MITFVAVTIMHCTVVMRLITLMVLIRVIPFRLFGIIGMTVRFFGLQGYITYTQKKA